MRMLINVFTFNRFIHLQEDKQYSLLDSKCIDQPVHMRMLINVLTLNLHMRLIILTLACKGLLISDRRQVRFATLVKKNVVPVMT